MVTLYINILGCMHGMLGLCCYNGNYMVHNHSILEFGPCVTIT